jgi:hypothetical protein
MNKFDLRKGLGYSLVASQRSDRALNRKRTGEVPERMRASQAVPGRGSSGGLLVRFADLPAIFQARCMLV